MNKTHIKRFRLNQELGRKWLNEKVPPTNAAWIHQKATRCICYAVNLDEKEIYIDIRFPNDLSTWDDFEFIIVIDEDSGQPYTPFYAKLDSPNWEGDEFLNAFIRQYNNLLSDLPFLEEIKIEE